MALHPSTRLSGERREWRLTVGALHEHTRYDLIELARQGVQFLERLRQNQGLGDQKTRFRSWLSQLDRLVKDGIDATERMTLEDGLIVFHDFFAGGAMPAPEFVGLVARIVGSLQTIRRGSTFKQSDVPDDTFTRFLLAARFENEQLGVGVDIALADVATTSKLDIAMARRCLARLVDERLGREGDKDDGFKIELQRVQFALQELDRNSRPAKGADIAARLVPAPMLPVRTASSGGQGPDALGARPLVDVAILTIKEEEFTAVLGVFPEHENIFVGPKSHRHYNLRSAGAGEDAQYRLAITRHEQGNGEALDAARDVLDELQPSLLLVVGIAGGRPSDDFTLGDVVLSLRINDYSVHASGPDSETEYDIAGGPVAHKIRGGVMNLPARLADLGDWTSGLPARPAVDLDDARFVGPDEWKKLVRGSLERHFVTETRIAPLFTMGVIGSSDGLIKDANILIEWLKTARKLLAVEMESGGVYRATRERCPMLAIRGISDIVGFKRDERWTRYACASAAAFARAYLRTQPIPPGSRTGGRRESSEPSDVSFDVAFRTAKDYLRRGRFRKGEDALLALVVRADAEGNTIWALRGRLELAWRKAVPATRAEAEELITECDAVAKGSRLPLGLGGGLLRARCRLAVLKGDAASAEPVLSEFAGCDLPGDDADGAYQILRAGVDLAMLHAGFGRTEDAMRWSAFVEKRAPAAVIDKSERVRLSHAVEEVGLRLAVERGDCATVEAIARSWSQTDLRDDAEENAGVLIHYANVARHVKQYACGVPCAAAAAVAARTADLDELVLGADQIHATLLCMAGRVADGLRLNAEVLERAGTMSSTKVLVTARLLAADYALQQQDAVQAREHAEAAWAAARGDDIAEVMSLQCLADACWLDGDAKAAHRHLAEALRLGTRLGMPPRERARLLHRAVDIVGQEGLWDEADRYLDEWEQIPLADDEDQREREHARHRVDGYRRLHSTYKALMHRPGSTLGDEGSPSRSSVQEGLAQIVSPVLEWWDDLGRASADQLDYWGRGNFVRVVRHLRSFARAFTLIVEARDRSDIERAVRLCGVLADVILVLWKGKCVEGRMLALAPFHHEGPGGAGYILAAGSRLDREGLQGTWVPGFVNGRYLPEGVVDLLAKDARRWFASGRLLVVPAWSVGCINHGVGPLERLLVDAVCALPIARSATPLSLPWQLVPWFPDVPLADLADVAEDPAFHRPRLRQLLMERTRGFAAATGPFVARELEQEIEAELSDLQEVVRRQRQQHGWDAAQESWTTARIRSMGEGVGNGVNTASRSPWIPFLRVGQLGYEWQVARVSEVLPSPLPAEREAGGFTGAGEWLAPEDAGPAVPTVCIDGAQDTR